MQTTQRDWYDTPLYYDIIFDGDTQQEARFLLDAYAKHASKSEKPPHILEPACGSGRLMKALASEAKVVHGFDLSSAMVDYAAARVPQAKVWQDRMESFTCPLPQYDLAHCLVSTFKYLLTEAHARAHLRHVAKHLRTGGIYALGIHLTDYQNTRYEHERWSGTRNGLKVICNTRTWPADRKTRLEPLRTRLTLTQNGRTQRQETRWHFRTYDAAQVKQLLKSVPELHLVACYDFQHDIQQPRSLDDSYSDILLILRKK
jgi:SAM-dependent methyltransferase